MEADCEVNIILLGESDVGKTSLLLRFVEGKFKDVLSKTIINKYEKVIEIDDSQVKLILWDTAGRDVYHGLVKSYCSTVDGALFVYDLQNADTFSGVLKWFDDFNSVNKNAEVLIVGNKADKESDNSENTTNMKTFVQTKELDFFKVSAQTSKNVNCLFRHLVQKILISKTNQPHSQKRLSTELETTKEYIPSSSISTNILRTVDISNTSSETNTKMINTHMESTEQRATITMNALNEKGDLVTFVESNENAKFNTVNAPKVVESLVKCEKLIEQPLHAMQYESISRTNDQPTLDEICEESSLINAGTSICPDAASMSYRNYDDALKIAEQDSRSADSAEIAEEFFQTNQDQTNVPLPKSPEKLNEWCLSSIHLSR